MANNLPFISIIIPCRNEEKFIGKCLDSILAQDYPKEKLEILIMDGMSEDKTREVIKEYGQKHSFVRLLDNPDKVTPKAMNIGVQNSRGEVIVLPVNAHSVLDREFLKWNIYYLNKIKEADAVGGKLNATSEDNVLSKTVQFIADSVFGSGGVRYRQREKEGFVKDTLPYCAYRREVFDKIGLVDEELIRGNDAELNLRLLKKGGKLYFSPKIKSCLYTRPSLQKFYKQQFQYGYFKIKIAQKLGWGSVFRQTIPGIFVFSLMLTGVLGIFFKPLIFLFLIILGSYFLVNIFFSFQISLKYGLKYFFPCLFAFFVLHISYGFGFLKGIFDFLLLKKKVKKDIGITR